MDIIAQLLPKTGLFRKILSLIAAISMLVSLVSGFAPEPLPRDEAQNIIFIIGDGMGENHPSSPNRSWESSLLWKRCR